MRDLRQLAIDYIKPMSDTDRERLRTMLVNGILCGADYAREHEADPVLFSNELASVFGGK